MSALRIDLADRLELVRTDETPDRAVLAIVVEAHVADRLVELTDDDRERFGEWLRNDVELAASLTGPPAAGA